MTAKKIREFIKRKGIVLEPEDEYLIKEFKYNESLMALAKKEVKEFGILVNVSTKPGVESYQKNQAIAVYDAALKTLFTISSKLGLSPADRKKLIEETAQAPSTGGFKLE